MKLIIHPKLPSRRSWDSFWRQIRWGIELTVWAAALFGLGALLIAAWAEPAAFDRPLAEVNLTQAADQFLKAIVLVGAASLIGMRALVLLAYLAEAEGQRRRP